MRLASAGVAVLAALLLGTLSITGAAVADAAAMQVFVKLPAGTVIVLDVESSDSVENVRTKIQDKFGVAPEQQVLTYGGTILVDGLTLADYNVQNETTIFATVPLLWTNSDLAAFKLGEPFADGVVASPGFAVPAYSVGNGALPDGIVLNPATGELTGTPSTAGPFSFAITATRDAAAISLDFAGSITDPTPAPALAATGADATSGLVLAALALLAGGLMLARPRRAARL